jgi:pimeloyl-ACP methyl ester carboxylesterase
MTQLNYERRGKRAGPETRTLVLIHGIGSRWQMWEPVMDRLTAEHDVLALDLPGFGFSPPLPAGSESSARGLAEQVSAFLRQMAIDRPHAVGNSLGGWVSLELARLGQVSSVTAFSPAGFANSMEAVWSRTSLIATRWAAQRLRPQTARLAQNPWFRRMAYWQMSARPANLDSHDVAESTRALADAPGFDDILRSTTAERFRPEPAFDVTVTIAWGEKDRLLAPRQAARPPAALPGARIVKLPGCGHIPTYDDPELVAQVILEGLAAS